MLTLHRQVQFASYNAESHNNFVSIQEAKGYLESAGGINFINGPLRNAILKHNKGESKICIRLLVNSPIPMSRKVTFSPRKGSAVTNASSTLAMLPLPCPSVPCHPRSGPKLSPLPGSTANLGSSSPSEYSLSLESHQRQSLLERYRIV